MTSDRLRRRILSMLAMLYARLETRWFPQPEPKPVAGKLLAFQKSGRNLGHDVLSTISRRGGMYMGTVEWSNQWNRPRFKPDGEAVFDQQCIAEIYACMREMK